MPNSGTNISARGWERKTATSESRSWLVKQHPEILARDADGRPRKFLAYLARADLQEKFNEAILQLPIHIDAKAKDDHFLNIGAEMLSTAGTAQFYNRDTQPEMTKAGMKGFQEFMVKSERLDKILKRLEKARKRIFKVKG